MGDVVSTDGTVLQKDGNAANKQVVECLEYALKMAQAGEIIGVSVVYRFLDGAAGSNAAGYGNNAMIGRMTMSLHELIDDLKSGDE